MTRFMCVLTIARDRMVEAYINYVEAVNLASLVLGLRIDTEIVRELNESTEVFRMVHRSHDCGNCCDSISNQNEELEWKLP